MIHIIEGHGLCNEIFVIGFNMKHLLNSTITTDLQKIMKVGIYIGEKQKYYIFSWNSAWTYNDSYKWNLYTTNLLCKTGRWTDLQSHLDYYKSYRILIFMPKVWRIFYFRDEAFSSLLWALFVYFILSSCVLHANFLFVIFYFCKPSMIPLLF